MLTASNVDWNAGPPPVVDVESHSRVRIGLGVRIDTLLLAKSRNVIVADSGGTILSSDAVDRRFFGLHDPDRSKHLCALIADNIGFKYGGRLHRYRGETLQEVILNHVAESARFLVVPAPAFDADRLSGRNLHLTDVSAIPHRLEDAVAE